MRRYATGTSAGALAILLLATTPAAAAGDAVGVAAVNKISRVSITSAENQVRHGGLHTQGTALSGAGNVVVFESNSPSLVSGDTNGAADVFVRDRRNGTTKRASVGYGGRQGNDGSSEASISNDGRYVVFTSGASNLTGSTGSGDANNTVDVFRRDLVNNVTSRVSRSVTGGSPNGPSIYPVVSGDGRYVAWQSGASNIVKGDTNGREDVFVRDMVLGTTRRVSLTNTEGQFRGASAMPSISLDGNRVSFSADTYQDDHLEIYVRDIKAGTTRLVHGGAKFPHSSTGMARISGYGRHVVYMTETAGVVSGDTNAKYDCFRYDMTTGTTIRASVSNNEYQGNNDSDGCAISRDGRFVAFSSLASNLVLGDTNGDYDVFVRDTVAKTTRRVSVSTTGAQGNSRSGSSNRLSISPNGLAVSFGSFASNLVPGDTNAIGDVFVWNAS